MIAKALDKLAELVRRGEDQSALVDGRWYTRDHLHPVLTPLADPIGVHTLTGFLEAFAIVKTTLSVIRVRSYKDVRAFCSEPVGSFQQTQVDVMADHDEVTLQGGWMAQDEMVVELSTKYAQTEARDKLLKICGLVKDEMVTTQADDGISQKISIQSGVSALTNATLPPFWTLQPLLRTFPEIDSPESPFLLRLDKAEKGGIMFRLIPADAGLWKFTAVDRIVAFLQSNLGQEVPIVW